jgi:hypothetical protein
MQKTLLSPSDIKQGLVLYVSFPIIAKGIPHYWVILNEGYLHGEEVLYVIASSQLESAQEWCRKRRVPVSTDSLVVLLEEDEPFLSKDTVFNCHQVKAIELSKLNKLNFEKRGIAKNETVDWLRNAIKASEIVEPEIKKRLKLST